MKILLTGANGYLGKGILNELVKTDNVIIAASHAFDEKYESVIYKRCDIFDVTDPISFFEYPDVVLHFAWNDGFVHMSDSHLSNLYKHYSFLKSFIDNGIKKVCVAGSVHEIGFYEGSVNENTPCNPKSFYGISKNALRQSIELLCNEKNVLFQWIRGYYIVGNQIKGSSIFSKIAASNKANIKNFPFTMGQNQFDFIDYNLFCEYVVKIVLQNEICGIINCCSGRPEKIADRVERFITEENYDIKLEYGKFKDRPYDSKAIWGDDLKIKKILEMYKK